MDACAHKGIIPRAPGPRGVMVSDIKRVFSQLWQGSQQVVVLLETLKKKDISPEEVLELFFDGGSEDQVLWCFVILVWLNHEDTSVLLRDLPDHAFDNVDDAYNWFFTNIYAKQKTCSGRSYGRKKPRSTA